MAKRTLTLIFLTAILSVGAAMTAQAELFAVSPTPEQVAGSPFPEWYQDFSDPAANADAFSGYGIGPNAGGLKLELCLDENGLCLLELDTPGAPVVFPTNFGPEVFWWAGGAAIANPNGLADLVLAIEGAFANEVPIAGEAVVFGRVRIRIDVDLPGTYTVTHPYGVEVFTVDAVGPGPEINFSDDFGALDILNFNAVLGSNVGAFLFWDADLPVTDAGTPGAFYVGNPGLDHAVLGSPLGTNFFRIEGPAGSNLGGSPAANIIETNLFSISGKVFTGDGNTAPVAVNDAATTLSGTAAQIDILANDTFTDIPINPGSVTFVQPVAGQGTVTKSVVNGRVMATYTPGAFIGPTSFSYNIANLAGTAAAQAGVVDVLVENLQLTKAEFRPKLLKWRIAGTSSDTTANSIAIQSGPPTVASNLSGTNIVPTPVTSSGSGTAALTVGADSLSFNLALNGLLNITATHIHVGGPGENGPIIFTLAGANIANRSATLTAADLQPQAAQGINTFADAMNAILGGQAYVQTHTTANPAGQLRGQLGPNRLVGSATVQSDGNWSLDGKSKAVPDDTRTISIRSSNGIEVNSVPVKVK